MALPRTLSDELLHGLHISLRYRDECLNEHWFTSLAHARVVIEDWRREYNDERPKKALGGLTPTAYAQQLTTRTETAKVTAGL